VKNQWLAILTVLTSLPQTTLDYLDKTSLAQLAALFLHWSVACQEAMTRPTRREPRTVK
jgi:hypothetical protein